MSGVSSDKDKKASKNVLKNLILHRKLCNHPCMIVDDLKADKEITNFKNKNKGQIKEAHNSGKL